MNWAMVLSAGIGVTAAVLVGTLIYRDASARGVTRPAIWSATIGTVSGVGLAVSMASKSELHLMVHEAIHENSRIVAYSPFEVLLVGLFAGLAIVATATSVYVFSTRSGWPIASA